MLFLLKPYPSNYLATYGHGHAAKNMANTSSDCRFNLFKLFGCFAKRMNAAAFLLTQPSKHPRFNKSSKHSPAYSESS